MTHLLCIGDSITDSHRLFAYPPLGNGYVQMLAQKLDGQPLPFEITNCGVDGFTVQRLLEQVHSRYLPLKPDVVTILIGINDIGLMMNTNRTKAQQKKMMQDFSIHYEALIQEFSSAGCRMILMEPFIFPWPLEYQTWLPLLHTMSGIISDCACRHHLSFVPLHEDLNQQGRCYGLDFITTDGIHLTLEGHRIITEKLLPLLLL